MGRLSLPTGSPNPMVWKELVLLRLVGSRVQAPTLTEIWDLWTPTTEHVPTWLTFKPPSLMQFVFACVLVAEKMKAQDKEPLHQITREQDRDGVQRESLCSL